MLDEQIILKHYLIAALWTGLDDDDNPLDDNYTADDISNDASADAMMDIKAFLALTGDFIGEAIAHYHDSGMAAHADAGSVEACIGHDLWLTRNGHGVGFWDRGMLKTLGEALTDVAQDLGEVYIYVGDDDKIYFD